VGFVNTKKCLICQNEKGKVLNETLYWHVDKDTNDIWCWCNREGRGYSIYEYCAKAGLSLSEFLKQDFDFKESSSTELNKMDWPKSFVPMFHRLAKPGVKYVKSRGLEPTDNMYYDVERKGIVFPYFYDTQFCGAQIRFIEEWTDKDGNTRKIDTVPGTRLGLLVYNWDQIHSTPYRRAFIICEGAFNAIAIQQALYSTYNPTTCPYTVVALSGSGASEHHRTLFKEQIESTNCKVILAPDSDTAGVKMLKKMKEAGAITHFAFTGDSEYDWNDVYKEMMPEQFLAWFLKRVQRVES
jgi:DNA primase